MRLRRGRQFPGTCSLVLSLRLRVQLVRLRLSQAACACQEAATMPSLYSRFTHNPLQRMLLVQAGGVFLISTLALFGSSDTWRCGASSSIADTVRARRPSYIRMSVSTTYRPLARRARAWISSCMSTAPPLAGGKR